MWPAGGGFSFLFFFFRGLILFFLAFFGGWKMFFILDFFLVGEFFGRDGLEHFDLRKCQI